VAEGQGRPRLSGAGIRHIAVTANDVTGAFSDVSRAGRRRR
jgi:4-hydroxyphenylpyruvate dioxygenase-like putative hemolysin